MMDMNEMIGHIFGSLHNSEKAINKIVKVLNAQYKYNKSVSTFAVLSTICLTLQCARTNQLERKIDALNKELKDLKSEKGE